MSDRQEKGALAGDPLLLVLGICPMLAACDTVAHALGLGLSTVVALTLSGAAVATLNGRMHNGLRFAAAVLIVASIVGSVALLMDAWFHELRRSLGIFLPLLAANVLITWRAQELAAVGAGRAALYGLKTSGTVLLILLILGTARELVGRGSLLHDAGPMLGTWAEGLAVQMFRPDMGFLLAMLPPGAFIALALLVAGYRWLRGRRIQS